MKRSRFIECQIIKVLTEQDKCKTAVDIYREHKISQPTFFQWKNKCFGIDINQLKQMKDKEKKVVAWI